jgi:hypothetical protein
MRRGTSLVVGFVIRLWVRMWGSVMSSRILTLNGWVAFDLPRTVTAIGAALLTGIVAVHVYVLTTESALPGYFVIYSAALIAGCLIAATAMIAGSNGRVPQGGWYVGSFICVAFLGVYLVSRVTSLPGLGALTGRWDVAPGTLAMALAAGFVAVHTTVVSGINVAYPHRQGWRD